VLAHGSFACTSNTPEYNLVVINLQLGAATQLIMSVLAPRSGCSGCVTCVSRLWCIAESAPNKWAVGPVNLHIAVHAALPAAFKPCAKTLLAGVVSGPAVALIAQSTWSVKRDVLVLQLKSTCDFKHAGAMSSARKCKGEGQSAVPQHGCAGSHASTCRSGRGKSVCCSAKPPSRPFPVKHSCQKSLQEGPYLG
jgi:hypothetical protein